ncbi:hypothetical protein H2203_000896 [Taxawa tesnikishii (nom. ined.)]|nr:hypothetical protein H2203_000896 [Dothideales sp. JES 119]
MADANPNSITPDLAKENNVNGSCQKSNMGVDQRGNHLSVTAVSDEVALEQQQEQQREQQRTAESSTHATSSPSPEDIGSTETAPAKPTAGSVPGNAPSQPAIDSEISTPPCADRSDTETTVKTRKPKPPVIYGESNQEHPLGDEIRKQVEWYFSDENLPHDAHLLGFCGGKENRPVSINRICGFTKMRRFKPRSSVVASLKKSTFLEVVDDDKYIKRRVALSIEPIVAPQVVYNQKDEEKPWMTKGMLKPTGFEDYYADAPVTPAVYQEERKLYELEAAFFTRIETAIQRYCARRKFHQTNLQIFDRFLKFGGIDSGPKQFTGGLSKEDLETKDAEEIAIITARHYVAVDCLDEHNYYVDFEEVAKGFLSSHFPSRFGCSTTEDVTKCTNILRNFYRYLLHHDVCPEYAHQIHAALRVCDQADKELVTVDAAGILLPGPFNLACSILHGGNYAGVYNSGPVWDGAEKIGFSDQDARALLMAGIVVFGTEEQKQQVEHSPGSQPFKVISEKTEFMEVQATQRADDETRSFYDSDRLKYTLLRPLGKLHCRRWPEDNEDFIFWVEEEILEHCFVGMKIEARVYELDLGIKWIDCIHAVRCSFFTYLENEKPRVKATIKVDDESGSTTLGGEADEGDRSAGKLTQPKFTRDMVQVTEWKA